MGKRDAKMHPLTEAIWRRLLVLSTVQANDADYIVKEWLEEKAKELKDARHPLTSGLTIAAIDAILGLSNSSEELVGHKEWMSGGNTMSLPPKPSSEKWCSHCIHSPIETDRKEFHLKGMGIYCDQFQFCPICGTPRPKPKELWEKLMDYSFGCNGGQEAILDQTACKDISAICASHFSKEA